MKVRIIAWDGDVHQGFYVVEEDQVDAFLARFNDSGAWQVIDHVAGPQRFLHGPF